MKLNASKRNALPDSDFALPGRKYPINDKNHARLAKAYAAKDATPSEKATIDAKANKVLKTGWSSSSHKAGCSGTHMGACKT